MNILFFITPKSETAYLYDDCSLRQAIEKIEYHKYTAVPVHGRCKVKAAGGISTVEDMETFLALGADRLGTSRAVKILNGEQATGY